MQIPILNGVYTDAGADFRASYPVNLMPVPRETGISKGYLRTAEGMIEFANSIQSDSYDRGAINWNGTCYRVIGDYLTRVNSDQTIDYLGLIANDGKRAVLVNGFDRLAIAAAGKLHYWTPANGVEVVTDPDIGTVLDVIWAAGYYMTTDGASLVVTDLNDPLSVNPLKYGSSEASPDPVNSLLYLRNEAIAVNRYTCEFFQNIGGDLFPFQRVEGAMIPKGSIGTHASCYFLETFAFVGGGQNEGLSVYIASQATAAKVATGEIETILQQYTEAQLASLVVESRADRFHQLLYVHLPDQTLVYDHAATQAIGEPVWFVLNSGTNGDMPYRARNYVRAYDKWLFGDLQSKKIGYFTHEDARQFGDTVPMQFETMILYNEGRGAIIHDLELVRLAGRGAVSPLSPYPTTPTKISLSYSDDGQIWSAARFAGSSRPGTTSARATWRRCGNFSHFRALRFQLLNSPYPDAFARLEAVIEPLEA